MSTGHITTTRTGTLNGNPVRVVGYKEGATGTVLEHPTRRTTHLVAEKHDGTGPVGTIWCGLFVPDENGAA